MSCKKVTVVGAGAMGASIAQALAAASGVMMIDVSPDLVEKGRKGFFEY
jgi:3-hydroxyacyl-CoA dehydrogenase